ncbi:MAG: trypsin-like peptidase domain-containing protein [Balneolaceae bacterium]
MRTRDILLSGTLLILIGVCVGLVLSILSRGHLFNDFADVRITEVSRSIEPSITPEFLENLDSRFLFQSIAQGATPSVVFIETTIPLNGRRSGVDDEEEERMWDRLMPQRRALTVGSGVLITEDGYILTNHHVVEGSSRSDIRVILNDKRSYTGRVVGSDPGTDLAVVKIDAKDLPAIVLGNSDRVQVGEWVLAVGNPFRLRSTVTAGIVSAMGRDVQILSGPSRIESFIQTDAAINRGNSGGALVNTSGELIGINTAIATQSGNYQGYGFAVPSNLALRVAEDLIRYGEFRRGMLGIGLDDVDDRRARSNGLNRIGGVFVTLVGENSAASEAGIEEGDIILEVNGEMVDEVNHLQQKVAMFRPGDSILLTLWREGESYQVEATLREMELVEQNLLDLDELEPLPDELFEEEWRQRE